MDQNEHFKVALAVDLGAKYTGVFLTCRTNEGKLAHNEAFTIVMPDNDKFTYSTQNRTATRHRLRGQQRFKLARRLLIRIVLDQIETYLHANPHESNAFNQKKVIMALCGLLKRRGYSRLEAEVDLKALDECVKEVFMGHDELGKFFCHPNSSLREQFDKITQDQERIRDLDKVLKDIDPKSFSSYLKKEFPDLGESNKSNLEALKVMKDAVDRLNTQLNSGHKSRAEYLDILRDEIKKDSRLKVAIEAIGGEERLRCLIGNLSNLQLRAERWYFNAPQMADEKAWEPQRLQKSLIRAFKYFHPDSEDKARIEAVIQTFEKSCDIVDTLCTLKPEQTIPPYEDQNNRHPPIDQTLWLSPQALDRRYGERWEQWSTKFATAEPMLKDGLDDIIKLSDRKSRVKALKGEGIHLDKLRASYILQRVLDRVRPTTDDDRPDLRALARQRVKDVDKLSKLEGILGAEEVAGFLELASTYYREVEDARDGLWLPNNNSVLELAGIHPPRKKAILEILVGNILGVDEKIGDIFIKEVWGSKLKGRSTVRSLCEGIEKLRKQYGNEFNAQYYSAIQSGDKEKFVQCQDKVKTVSEYIGNRLHLDQDRIERFCNPYSLAQLYTLIETELEGFTSTTVAAHRENGWRMTAGQGGSAVCSRLPADAVRPFDGVLRKGLDRQAYELAKITADTIKRECPVDARNIDFTVIVEENKFSFSVDLATIKNSSSDKLKSLKKGEEDQEKQWDFAHKKERIKDASRGICAYSGVEIGDKGEIDHILPRSLSRALFGTVFNSEQNLIYVSRDANNKKLDQRYYLRDLDPKYLQKVFGTSDLEEIRKKIQDTVIRLRDDHRLPYFDSYRNEPGAQDCVRHALFLFDNDEAFQAVQQSLLQLNKTRVNGTQAWLIKQVIGKLQTLLGNWLQKRNCSINYRSIRTDAHMTYDIRASMGRQLPEMRKIYPQPVASHAIDAMCAYAGALGNRRIAEFTGGDSELSSVKFSQEDAKALANEFPNTCKVIRVSAKDSSSKEEIGGFWGRPVFKESLYGDDFLPILQKGDRFYVGFSLPNSKADTKNSSDPVNAIEVQGKRPQAILEVLQPFFKKSQKQNSKDAVRVYRIDHHKAFELFAKVAMEPCSEEELKIAALLESLEFFSIRKEIKTVIFEKNNLRKIDEITNKFNIKSKYTSNDIKFNGTVIFPTKYTFKHIIQEIVNGTKDINEFFSQIGKQRRKANNNRARAKVKTSLSLPIIEKPSGGFRIRRRNYDGSYCYQICCIKGDCYRGFNIGDDNNIDFKKDATLFSELSFGNIIPVEGRFNFESSVVNMNEWRRIKHNIQGIELWIAPGTKLRRYVRIKIPYNSFVSAMRTAAETPCDGRWSLYSEIKLNNPDEFLRALNADLFPVIGSPRKDKGVTKLIIEECGDHVVMSYEASSKKERQEAYNKGSWSK